VLFGGWPSFVLTRRSIVVVDALGDDHLGRIAGEKGDRHRDTRS
jgi:hypothetical protein